MNNDFDRWIHLDFYERKYLKEVIDSYDQIMATTDDVVMIANYYQLSLEEVTLDLCNSLPTVKYQPTVIPCKAIINLCQIAKQEDILLQLLHQHQEEVKKALNSVDDYARNADNWRVKNEDCSLGFGVKDHCTILNFLLNLNTLNSFCSYSGVFKSQETIISFLYDWQKIEFTQLSSLLVN